jgi:hypothetical protein
MHTKFWSSNLKGRNHAEGGSEDNIRMNLGERGWKGVDWIHLVQDRNQWRALVNTNFGFN